MRTAAPFSFLLLLPLLVAATAPAQLRRVIKTFDFEERRLGNLEELPMHWAKVEGPGLPHYVNGRLSTERARGGQYSFQLDLNGGSVIYRLETGQIPVLTGGHYRVEGYCQTTALVHARARMTACFTDVDGHVLAASIAHSELYAGGEAGADWHRFSIELSADDPQAAFIVIQVELLQPMLYEPATLGQRTLFDQDIRGSAWFDDVSVSQVPRIVMRTEHPGNIFRRGDKPLLDVIIDDRFTDDLADQLIVCDAAGQPVYQHSGSIDLTGTTHIAAGQQQMTLALPVLKAGWYQATLDISSRGRALGSQSLDFIQLADDGSAVAADDRFGIIATNLPFDGWDQLPALLPMLSAGRVKLAVWSAAGDVEQHDSQMFDGLLEKLDALGITPTACLTGLPPDVSTRPGGDWTQILDSGAADWQSRLSYMIARHANQLDRWQLGDDASEEFVNNQRMRAVYDRVYRQFAALTQSPDLAMPWPAWYDMPSHLPATIALAMPARMVLPSQVPLYVADIRGGEGHNLSLSLGWLERDRYGRDVQLRDFAQRIIYALSANVKRIDLPLPFGVSRQGGQSGNIVSQPQELLLVERTLIRTLSGATYKGRVPMGEGIESFLFDRGGVGIMVLWTRDEGDSSKIRELTLSLGQTPSSVDLFGNVTPLVAVPGGDGAVRVPIGPTPLFLVDIDGPMAQFRASVAVDRPLLESSFAPHVRHIHFVNSWPMPITGTIHLEAPKGWILNPPTITFSLNPGQAFDREISISLPYSSLAGPKTLDAQFVLQTDHSLSLSVPIALQLGLSDVGMQTLALRDGNDVVVQQMITNYSENPVSYSAFAIFPGAARQERILLDLAPGRTVLKQYRFKDARLVPGVKVRIGLRELQGTRILNDEIEVK